MRSMRVLALSVLVFGLWSVAGQAQNSSVNWTIAPVDKSVPTKKVEKSAPAKKSAGQSSSLSMGSDKAARLEEGRKKFFEQSSGFDHSSMWDKTNMNMGSGGTTPGVGFGF